MAALVASLIFAMAIFGSIDFSTQDVSQCYVCGRNWPPTEDAVCNDPVSISGLSTEPCTSVFSGILQRVSPKNDTALLNITDARASGFDVFCAKLDLSFGGSRQVVRGCDYTITGVDYCDHAKIVGEQAGISVHGCSRCNSNLCNSAATVLVSAVTLISAILLNSII